MWAVRRSNGKSGLGGTLELISVKIGHFRSGSPTPFWQSVVHAGVKFNCSHSLLPNGHRRFWPIIRRWRLACLLSLPRPKATLVWRPLIGRCTSNTRHWVLGVPNGRFYCECVLPSERLNAFFEKAGSVQSDPISHCAISRRFSSGVAADHKLRGCVIDTRLRFPGFSCNNGSILICVDLAHFKNRNNQDIIQPTKPLRSPLC